MGMNDADAFMAAARRQAERWQGTLDRLAEHDRRVAGVMTRQLDDGCQACNMVTADCTDKRQRLNEPCCGMCGHP